MFTKHPYLLRLIVLNLLCLGLSAQEVVFYCGYTNDRDMGEQLCNFTQQSSFSSSADAEQAVDQILAPLGLPRNFVLVSCPKIHNAIAITPDDGLRYIVYDNAFISRLNTSGVDWKAMSILAHELGHHLCGHTLRSSQSLEEQRYKELEADEFSGFIMQKLGASLEQAQAAVNEIASDGNDAYSTHPNKEKRLASVLKGYEKAGGSVDLKTVDDKPGSESFFYQANLKYSDGDLQGAIALYSKAIEVNPKFAQAYYNRGQARKKMKDYNGAVVDFSLAIQNKPSFPEAYNYRGQVQFDLGNYNSALSDLTIALEGMPKSDPLACYYRGMAKKQLGDYQGAYSDISNAIMLEPKASFYSERGVVRNKLGDAQGAISDYTLAINLDPTLELAYFNRGMSKYQLTDYQGAVSDLQYWLKNHPDDIEASINIGLCYLNMQNFDMAVSVFTDVITQKPEYAKAYYYRGMAGKGKGESEKALADYNQAIGMGLRNAEIYYSRGGLNYELRNLEAAVSDLSIAIDLKVNYKNAHYVRGLAYQMLGEDAKACIDYTKACTLGMQQACMEQNTICH